MAAEPALWLAPATPLTDADERLIAEVLSPEEAERAAAFAAPHLRETYVTSHAALRLILAQYLGCAPREVPMVRETCPGCGGPHGRPAVAGGGVHFSLSHTGALALIAVADRPVGADLEQLPKASTVAQVSDQLHPDEQAELRALPVPERPRAFARVWTRKEAYFKGLGIGLGRSLSADYLGTGATPAGHPDGWTIQNVTVDDAHLASTATATSAALDAVDGGPVPPPRAAS